MDTSTQPDIDTDTSPRWYAMRDLSRSNVREPAYKQLQDRHIKVFTPLTRRLSIERGRRVVRETPVIHDLLFVHDTRRNLDPIVLKMPNLQYRYTHGGYCRPMTVRDDDMNRFIQAISTAATTPRYYRPDEITPAMYGSRVRIIGSNLDGYEGYLLSSRGTRRRRLLVTIPGIITAAIEISPEYLEIIP